MHITGIPSEANHGRSVMQLKETLELETPHDRPENVGASSEYPNMEASDVSQNSAYVASVHQHGNAGITWTLLLRLYSIPILGVWNGFWLKFELFSFMHVLCTLMIDSENKFLRSKNKTLHLYTEDSKYWFQYKLKYFWCLTFVSLFINRWLLLIQVSESNTSCWSLIRLSLSSKKNLILLYVLCIHLAVMQSPHPLVNAACSWTKTYYQYQDMMVPIRRS